MTIYKINSMDESEYDRYDQLVNLPDLELTSLRYKKLLHQSRSV
ncbi:hypothetical protein [Siminovitchia terrae]|nr:hypothetical protein [Siminovitchia terrae]